MFCTNCGKKIPDNMRFCTFCGTPTRRAASEASAPASVETPVAPPVEPPAVVPPVEAPAPVMSEASAPERLRRSKVPVIAAVACAVVALGGAGVAAALTGGFGLLGDKGPAATEVTQTYEEPEAEQPDSEKPEAEKLDSEKPSETQTDATQTDAAEPVQVTVEQEEAVTPSSIRVSLSDQTDLQAVNIAVTNFTELAFDKEVQEGSVAFDRSCSDYARIVNYYREHVLYNDSAAYGVEGVPDSDPMSQKNYTLRVPVERARTSIARMLGVTLSDEQLTFDLNADAGGSDGPEAVSYFCHATVSGGYLYIGIYDGSAEPSLGVAYATNLTDLGDNRYRVDYDVYVPGGYLMPNEIELSWYGLPVSDLVSRIGASGVDRRGSAVFEVSMDGGTRRFILEQMSVSTSA